ncbi:MAG: ABC transporter ATP-binding protein [Gemmatimonadota bacterium]
MNDLTGSREAGATVANPLLEVASLRVSITSRAEGAVYTVVDGVDLDLGHGETLGLVGESGCGKTLTALAILGLLPPGAAQLDPSSSIRFQQEELVGELRRWRRCRGRGMAMVFQEPMTALNPVRTLGAMLEEALRVHGGGAAGRRREAVDRLDEVGIPQPRERLGSYPHQLSGGMRQRALLALALAGNPQLLVADEPTTALDAVTRGEILTLLERLIAQRNMALLLISHDLSIIARLCRRTSVMYAGSLVESGETRDVLVAPRHPYTRALVDTLPPPQPRRDTPVTVLPGAPPRPGEWPTGCRFHPRCGYVMERCISQEPPMGHRAACWLEVEAPHRLPLRPASAQPSRRGNHEGEGG